jgi:hypothetical protein
MLHPTSVGRKGFTELSHNRKLKDSKPCKVSWIETGGGPLAVSAQAVLVPSRPGHCCPSGVKSLQVLGSFEPLRWHQLSAMGVRDGSDAYWHPGELMAQVRLLCGHKAQHHVKHIHVNQV